MLDIIVANLPIIFCAVAGIALVTLEVFLPGFGLPGISGIVLSFVSIGLTWSSYGPLAALGLTLLIIAVLAVVVSISLKSAAGGALAKSKLVLQATTSREEGYEPTEDMQVFMGRSGVANTALRPVGIADFDGVRLNVVSEGEFLDAGQPVTIVQVEGARIVVRKA